MVEEKKDMKETSTVVHDNSCMSPAELAVLNELKINITYRWKKFPFEMDRFSCLIIKSPLFADKGNDLVKRFLNIYPLFVEESFLSVKKKTKIDYASCVRDLTMDDNWLDKFTSTSSSFSLVFPYMTREYAGSKNTKTSTNVVDLSRRVGSGQKVNSDWRLIKKLDDAVLGNTHALAVVNEEDVCSDYYEIFDMIIFVNKEFSNYYLQSRFKKQVNLSAPELEGKMVVIDTSLEHDTLQFL